MLCRSLIVLAASFNLSLAVGLSADEPPDFDRYLAHGGIQAGIDAAQVWLEEHPADNQVHLGLGVLRFVQAVEGLSQDLHHYGLRDLGRRAAILPFLRLPVPENPNPAKLDYAASREILVRVIAKLKLAEAELARVDGDAKLRIRLAAARLDMDGDGQATPEESLWSIYERLNPQARQLADNSDAFTVAFDRADAHWLRGYCNLLMAFAEVALAHEWKDSFQRTAHIFFADVDSPYEFLNQGRSVFRIGDGIDIADLIAFVHLINYPVAEPKRMAQARVHLKEMLQQSREMWRHAKAETDNDREWIPNSRQTALVPNVRVSEQMIQDWQVFLDEADALLDGRKLIPFWRGDERQGVNLQRVFLEPTRFDLVMWIQGTGAAPYLETGELTSPATWSQLQRTFQGNFWGFAIWFN